SREALRHQRFPVQAVGSDSGLRDSRRAANRLVVNFILARLGLDLGGVPATATFTTFGPVAHFGFFFLGFGNQNSLSTVGAGEPFSNIDPAELVAKLELVLAAMAADSTRPLSSLSVLVEAEQSRLDEFGNLAVMSVPEAARVSVADVFGDQA